ncbi:MAG: hypothetical protein JW982_03410 [Spirochaetes bacterium]|nr:hypothetical protein [Spirochaetota bacterium]
MKKILIILLILSSINIYAKDKGIGANIQTHSESEITESGGSEIEVTDETYIFGGSFHNFKTRTLEYEADVFFGYNRSDNGVSDSKQNFFGLGGGINFHILNGKVLSTGLGARLSFEKYMKPVRDPEVEYDSYNKFNIGLEMPIFLDVNMHEKFLIRFSAVAAGLLYDYRSQEVEGVKESQYNLDFYTTRTSNTESRSWFPISIYFIYKF